MLMVGHTFSVEELAKKKGVTMAQIAIAWILTKDGQRHLPCHIGAVCTDTPLLRAGRVRRQSRRCDRAHRGHDESRQPQGHPRYAP